MKVYRPDQVKVRLSTLNMGDMRHLLPEMTEKQQHLLSRALRKVSETKRGAPWSAEDLKLAIRSVAKQKGDEESLVGEPCRGRPQDRAETGHAEDPCGAWPEACSGASLRGSGHRLSGGERDGRNG